MINSIATRFTKPEFEIVKTSGDSAFRCFRYTCKSFQETHGWHYHPECEISYIVKGKGKRFVGDSVESFAAGSLVFIGPNVPHCWVSDDSETECEMIVLQFNPKCFGGAFLEAPDTHSLTQLIQKASVGLEIIDENTQQYYEALELVRNNSDLFRLSYFFNLLALLVSAEKRSLASDSYLFETGEIQNIRIEKALSYIRENMSNDIKQTVVAKLIGMTPQAFSRFFRVSTGRTFVSFVNRIRITEAGRLLLQTNEEVVNIATKCGYNSISNFNRRFYDIHQCTPTEFRRKQDVKGLALC